MEARKYKFVCNVTAGDVFLSLIGWFVLALATLGLALPFFGFWFVKYFINRTEIVAVE